MYWQCAAQYNQHKERRRAARPASDINWLTRGTYMLLDVYTIIEDACRISCIASLCIGGVDTISLWLVSLLLNRECIRY